jgi:hypothetical protein
VYLARGYDPYNTADYPLRRIMVKLYHNYRYGRMVMKKRDEIEQPSSCLNKAHEDEPVFVLRANDPIAPEAVETWARQAELSGAHEPHKIVEARALAQTMRDWRTEHRSMNRAQQLAAQANKHEG